jgi:hypothetical protein
LECWSVGGAALAPSQHSSEGLYKAESDDYDALFLLLQPPTSLPPQPRQAIGLASSAAAGTIAQYKFQEYCESVQDTPGAPLLVATRPRSAPWKGVEIGQLGGFWVFQAGALASAFRSSVTSLVKPD